MLNFITIVLAIIVANSLLFVGGLMLMSSKTFVKRYLKSYMKMADEITDELIYGEDETLD